MSQLSSLIHQQSFSWLIRYLLLIFTVFFVYNLFITNVYGSPLTSRYLQLSSNIVSAANVNYNLGFDIASVTNLGSIMIQFCANDPLFQDPCVPPTGFNDSGAVLSAQSGQTGFTILSPVSNNQIILTRPSTIDAAGPVSYTFTNINNPTVEGSFFVRIQTFSSIDASGTAIDYGGIAANTLNNLSISAEVPPFLYFCSAIVINNLNCNNASGSYVNFGDFTPTQTASGSSDLLVGTNGKNGYEITVEGLGLVSGNDVIPSISTSDVSRPGTSQFGINLVSNVSPVVGQNPYGPGIGIPTSNYNKNNFYTFNSGDIIASSNQSENYRLYTVSYIVNVSSTQPAGVYVSTINYICTANF